MSNRHFYLYVILGLLTGNLRAEDAQNGWPSIDFGRFPSPLLHTRVAAYHGSPATKANLHLPEPEDLPPHMTVDFQDAREYPAYKKGARYFFPAGNNLTVYRISEVKTAPYKTIQKEIALLEKLLAGRPKSVPFREESSELPDYPPIEGEHVFEAKLAYLNAPWGSGLCYLTQYTQEPGHFANNEELTYVFQGLSKEGSFYVSANFRVTHPKLPSGIDARPKKKETSSLNDTAFLDKQSDDSFTPSLSKIRNWIGTLELDQKSD